MCVDRVYCIQKYIHVKDADQKEEDDNPGNSTQITTEGLQPNQSNVIQKAIALQIKIVLQIRIAHQDKLNLMMKS